MRREVAHCMCVTLCIVLLKHCMYGVYWALIIPRELKG